MLIVGSVTLNLSACCGNATCAAPRERATGEDTLPQRGTSIHPHLSSQGQKPPARGSRAGKTRRSKTSHVPRGIRANCRIGPWTTTDPRWINPSVSQLALSLCKSPVPLRLLLQGPNHTFKKFGWGLFLSRMISNTLHVLIPKSSKKSLGGMAIQQTIHQNCRTTRNFRFSLKTNEKKNPTQKPTAETRLESKFPVSELS